MPVVEADRRPRQARGRRRRPRRARAARRPARGLPAALPAAADRLAPARPDVRRLAARAALVLRPAGDALRRLLLGDGLHPQAARGHPLLRAPPVHRHRGGALLRRDLERRHPLDLAEQGPGQEDADATGDLPGGLDAGGGVPHVAADARARGLPACSRAGTSPGPRSGPVLLGVAILVTFAMAMALFFSALNVFFRDFQNIVQTIMQFMHFLVPMMYPFSHGLGGARVAPVALPASTSPTRSPRRCCCCSGSSGTR